MNTAQSTAKNTASKETKTEHMRKGLMVAAVFVGFMCLAVLIKGIVAPRHIKEPPPVDQTAPKKAQDAHDSAAAFNDQIEGYRQQPRAAGEPAATDRGQQQAGAAAAGTISPHDQEQANFIQNQLRQSMLIKDTSDGGASAPSPPAMPTASGDVDARIARLNAQLATMKARQDAKGVGQ